MQNVHNSAHGHSITVSVSDKILITSVYLPCQVSSVDYTVELSNICADLQSVMDAYANYVHLIAGDFNFECSNVNTWYRIFNSLANEVSVKIKLIRSRNTFSLIEEHENRIKIESAILYVRKVKLSLAAFLTNAKTLETTNAKYPVRIVCKSVTISQGLYDCTHEKLFSGQLPNRIIVGIVRNDAFTWSKDHNPYNFEHYNCMEISVFADGQNVQNKTVNDELRWKTIRSSVQFALHRHWTAVSRRMIGDRSWWVSKWICALRIWSQSWSYRWREIRRVAHWQRETTTQILSATPACDHSDHLCRISKSDRNRPQSKRDLWLRGLRRSTVGRSIASSVDTYVGSTASTAAMTYRNDTVWNCSLQTPTRQIDLASTGLPCLSTNNETGQYFDSFGQPPQRTFEHYLNRHCIRWMYNTKQFQGVVSKLCGQ